MALEVVVNSYVVGLTPGHPVGEAWLHIWFTLLQLRESGQVPVPCTPWFYPVPGRTMWLCCCQQNCGRFVTSIPGYIPMMSPALHSGKFLRTFRIWWFIFSVYIFWTKFFCYHSTSMYPGGIRSHDPSLQSPRWQAETIFHFIDLDLICRYLVESLHNSKLTM
jgi:hypothetical protein